MGALDRLQDFTAKSKTTSEDGVFDVTTPAGAFLQRVHNSGYKMYEPCYRLKAEHMVDESTLEGEELDAYHAALEVSPEAYELFTDEFKDLYEKSFRHTELHDVLTTDGNQIVNAVAGSGKALMNGTRVLAEDGWRAIETLSVGDKVAGVDGKFHKVLGVFPQGLKDVYRMHFSDGVIIYCSGDHLWEFYSETAYDGAEMLMTPAQLCEKVEEFGEEKVIKPLKVHVADPIDYRGSESLLIEPYLLGVLLRSAKLHADVLNLTINSEEMLGKVSALVEPYCGKVVNVVENRYQIMSDDLVDRVKQLGLLTDRYHERFIPKEYLFARKADRLEFLRGYLTAEIEISGSAHVISAETEELLNDVIQMCESLGMVCKKHPVDGFHSLSDYIDCQYSMYPVVNNYEQTLFANGEVDEICSSLHDLFTRSLVSVKKIDHQSEMTCISIDAPRNLYLTEHFIPTHNTTMLVFKILHDIVTGKCMTVRQLETGMTVRTANKVWVCTFLRSGAAELESVLTDWQAKFGYSQTASTISFSTMDAEFKRCLNAMGVATPLDEGGKLYNCMVKAIDSCNIKRNGYNLSKEDYNIIGGIITYYRGRLDDQRYNHPSCKEYELTPTILDLLVKQFANLRQREGIMDFSEIMELLYKYLYVTPNPQVQEFVANRYNFIYIDEFQDTSQMAYAILKFYARGKLWINRGGSLEETDNEDLKTGLYTGHETLGKLVVVGDTAQCIYSFRGSDSSILAKCVEEDFHPIISTLSVNWRCPSNILNPVVPSIHKNWDSADQNIQAAHEGGELYAYAFKSYGQMLSQLKQDIQKDMDDGLKVAVLCRTNFDGLIPAVVLEQDGRFNFSVSGENMTMNSPLPKKLIGMTSLFTERATPSVKNSLTEFAGRNNGWAVKQLVDTLKMNNKSVWDIPEADIRYSCESLVGFVNQVKPVLYQTGVRTKESEVEALRVIYYMLMTDVYAGDSAYCESARAYIETLLFILENGDFKSVYEFLEEIDYLNDKLNGRIKKKKVYVQIATVHEFKGKEADSVYIWNDIDGVFPYSKCDLSIEAEVNEERRVHYIACTRAKKREHIYSITGKLGMFAREMDVKFTNPVPVSVTLPKAGARAV